jgi:hypothetical protein
MFEGIIANVLNQVLGQFIEGIESSQLNVSILSGDVELFNLAIKSDILDKLPLPFKLKYGKVGRVFVDVPVTGLLSKPLKVEVSEIFIMIEAKSEAEFSAEVIKEAFINSTLAQLEQIEEYFKSQIEIKGNESGFVMGIVNRIIDNIQVDVENIYIRFEDEISNPNLPYAVGVSLEAFSLYTSNERFEREFVSGNDKTHKTAKIKNFQVYLNTSTSVNDFNLNIKFDNIAEDEIEFDSIYDIIHERNEKGRAPSDELIKTKNFLLEEIRGHRENDYVIENFNIEVRAIYNKDPKKNQDPLAKISLVIGGNFIEGQPDDSVDEESTCEFNLNRQQMASILKFLNFSQRYTAFQTGVIKPLLTNKFTEEVKEDYLEKYEEYKKNDMNISKTAVKVTERIRAELGKLLELYPSRSKLKFYLFFSSTIVKYVGIFHRIFHQFLVSQI